MDSSNWNKTISESDGDFMQSVEWGHFQRALGREVIQTDAGGILSQAYRRPLGYGKDQIYVPMGPIPYANVTHGEEHLRALLAHKKSGTIFLECDLSTSIAEFEPTGGETRQPSAVSIVNIEDKTRDTLKGGFHSTLKENISRAERYQLTVWNDDGWELFYELYVQTMKRHELRPWHKEYIRALWDTLRPHSMVEIWSCSQGNDLLASNMYILFGSKVTHLFGGTSNQKRETMAPHYLHLYMMDTYARRGYTDYDMGKIDPVRLKNLTEFKERFGGSRKTYPGNFRYIIKPLWYRLYSLAKR